MSDSRKQAMADLAPVFAEAQADFAVNLLREVSLNSSASLILSPISIALALSMAYAGSKGETRAQFDAAFARGKSNEQLNVYFQNTLHELNSPKNVTLETVNRAYFDQSIQLLQSYKDVVQKYYGGNFQEVDFKNNKEPVVKEINDFVSEATHDKIKDLLSSDVIDDSTKLVLINAIYFKGDWLEKFPEKRTAEETFFVNENTEKKVQMMKMKSEEVKYIENDEVQVLELPYVDESTTFVAILPKEKFGLNKALQSLNGKKLLELKSALRKQEVNIELPKFKIEKEFSLKDVLSKLGFDKGFSDRADFSGIAKDTQLAISDVIHKGFVELDESGSTAAAASGLVMSFAMPSAVREPPLFRADHPFLFAILNTNQPLFVGTFTSV